jgi:hypothetical protein
VGIAPSVALAQPATPGQFTEAIAAPPAPDTDDTEWTLGLNGTFNYGNARSIALGATTHFMVRRDAHAFTLDLSFTYGAASVRDANGVFGDWNANTQNLNGRIRYDLFLDADDALFGVVLGTNNPFAGLDFRFQGQLGYMRNFFSEAHDEAQPGSDAVYNAHQRVWGEIGADVTYDDRFPNPLCSAPPMGVTVTAATCAGSDGMSYLLPGDELQPSARLYLGYDNHMNHDWSFVTGVEGLIDLRGNPHWGNVRINWRNTLALDLGSGLAGNVQFNFLYDGEPVPGRDPIDIQTIVGISYTLM